MVSFMLLVVVVYLSIYLYYVFDLFSESSNPDGVGGVILSTRLCLEGRGARLLVVI
jgi:hypothetical protein